MIENNRDLISKLRENAPKEEKNSLSRFGNDLENLAGDIKDNTKRALFNYHGNPQTYNQNKNRAIIGFGAGLLSGLLAPAMGIVAMSYGGIKAYQAYRDKKAQRYSNRDERGLENNGS